MLTSYIHVLIFRHSRLFVEYIFPSIKQVYACRQWRIQESFVRSTTSQLASLHHVRWNESPWNNLEVRKKWISLRAKSGLKGRWEGTSNYSVSRAWIVAPAVCGLALSCSNKFGNVDRLTGHPFRRRFLTVSMYRAELTVFPASKSSIV
jgi:hypothetical protein